MITVHLRTKPMIAIVVFLVGIGIIARIIAYLDYSQEITGTEWFDMQEEYIDEMNTYADNMDDIFTLYLSGAISAEDFQNHISILSDELKVMQTVYEKYKEEHPVRTGTHTYSSKIGCEAIENCYDTFEKILDMASQEENYSDINTLGYKYLAYQQEIIENLADYMGAKTIMDEEGGDDSE